MLSINFHTKADLIANPDDVIAINIGIAPRVSYMILQEERERERQRKTEREREREREREVREIMWMVLLSETEVKSIKMILSSLNCLFAAVRPISDGNEFLIYDSPSIRCTL